VTSAGSAGDGLPPVPTSEGDILSKLDALVKEQKRLAAAMEVLAGEALAIKKQREELAPLVAQLKARFVDPATGQVKKSFLGSLFGG